MIKELKCEGVVTPSGSTVHYNDKKEYHRIDGPAIITPEGHLEYYQNGKLHREDGPAIITGSNHVGPTGGERPLYFYKGIRMPANSQKEFERIIKLRMFL